MRTTGDLLQYLRRGDTEFRNFELQIDIEIGVLNLHIRHLMEETRSKSLTIRLS